MTALLRMTLLSALVASAVCLRGALFRSGRSDPLIRGMDKHRGFVTQDFLRFGRSAGFDRFNGDQEDFLPLSRIRALKEPLQFGFIF